MSHPLVELTNVEFGYTPGRLALRSVNLSVQPGEMTALIGSNGSGKSTLMKLIVGLVRPTVGAVRLNGQDTRGMRVSELAQQIGFIFQNPNDQLFAQTVEDEIRFGLRNLRLAEQIVEQRVEETLERFQLTSFRRMFPRFLSRGDKQKVCIASVVAMRPDVLLLDEPTTGQDHRDSEAILELAAELNRAGMTILIVTHDLINVAAYARRIVVLNDGEIAKDGPTLEVMNDRVLLEHCHLVAPSVVMLSECLHDLGVPSALTPGELISSIAGRLDAVTHS
jgi:energy-coupling factor transport system ATP-binding protein